MCMHTKYPFIIYFERVRSRECCCVVKFFEWTSIYIRNAFAQSLRVFKAGEVTGTQQSDALQYKLGPKGADHSLYLHLRLCVDNLKKKIIKNQRVKHIMSYLLKSSFSTTMLLLCLLLIAAALADIASAKSKF